MIDFRTALAKAELDDDFADELELDDALFDLGAYEYEELDDLYDPDDDPMFEPIESPADLEKYNPNHDPKTGQFAAGGGRPGDSRGAGRSGGGKAPNASRGGRSGGGPPDKIYSDGSKAPKMSDSSKPSYDKVSWANFGAMGTDILHRGSAEQKAKSDALHSKFNAASRDYKRANGAMKRSKGDPHNPRVQEAHYRMQNAAERMWEAYVEQRGIHRSILGKSLVVDDDFETVVPFRITKLDEEQQIVYGWASVTSENGVEITDLQGDVLDIPELRKAAHQFMAEARTGGTMHAVMDTGKIVESLVIDKDVKESLGINNPLEGWFIGYKVTSPTVWKAVKEGQFAAFSIGGTGTRVAEHSQD